MTSSKRPLTLGDLAVIATLLVIVTVVGFPYLSNCTYTPTPKTRMMGQLKQIGTALMIYADESDGRLPLIYNQPSLQSVLEPYTKHLDLFQAVENVTTPPIFNTNLAGVDLYSDIVPLGQTNPVEPSQIPMLYALLLDPKLNSPAVICYADSGTKAWPAKKPFNPGNLFQVQFERGEPSK